MFISAPAGMIALTLWLVEGPDLKLRFAVVWVTAALAGKAQHNKPPARLLTKTTTRDRMGFVP